MAAAAVDLDRALAVVDAALCESASERRCEQHAAVHAGVDVVLHDLLAEHGLADDPDIDLHVRLDWLPTEIRRLYLRVGEEPDGSHRPDVYRRRGVLGVHDDLVGASRIGHSPLDDGDAILVEVLAVDAARESQEIGHDRAIRGQRTGIDARVAPDLFHVGQPLDPPDHVAVETRRMADSGSYRPVKTVRSEGVVLAR